MHPDARMYTTLIVLAAASWILVCRRQFLGCQCERRTAQGLASCELWRRTYLVAPLPDSFPQPREERIVVWRLAGLPLWTSRNIIALPLDMDEQIGRIDPMAFDDHFRGPFALHQPAQAGSAPSDVATA